MFFECIISQKSCLEKFQSVIWFEPLGLQMLDIIYSTLKEMENVSRSTDQVSDQDTDQDDNISRLIKALGDKEMSATDIMSGLGLSHRPTFRKNYLAPALDKGIIERTIPDKPNSKNQKYRKVK